MSGIWNRVFPADGSEARDALRREKHVWVHPVYYWLSRGGFVCGVVFVAIDVSGVSRSMAVEILAIGILLAATIASLVNNAVIRSRRRHGWEHIDGVHTLPDVIYGQSPLVVAWRWTFHRTR
jgi:hypothetical protein